MLGKMVCKQRGPPESEVNGLYITGPPVRNVASVGRAARVLAQVVASPPGKYLPPLPARRSQGPGETAVTPVLEGGSGARGQLIHGPGW